MIFRPESDYAIQIKAKIEKEDTNMKINFDVDEQVIRNTNITFTELNSDLWELYRGAYGNIKCEIEVLLKEVSGEEVEQEEFEDAFENLCETLWHQMSFYKASYLAMPYMLKFLEQKIIFLYNSVGSFRG